MPQPRRGPTEKKKKDGSLPTPLQSIAARSEGSGPLLSLQIHLGQGSELQTLGALNSSTAHFLQPQGLCTGCYSGLECSILMEHIPPSPSYSPAYLSDLSSKVLPFTTVFCSDPGLGTFLLSACSICPLFSRFCGTLWVLHNSPLICELTEATPRLSVLLRLISLALSCVMRKVINV